MEVLGDSSSSGKSMPLQEQHPAMHHYHNHMTTPNVRRYPGMPSIDPAPIQMYPAPPQMYTAQNSSCYACLTVPVAGMQNRYSRYIRISYLSALNNILINKILYVRNIKSHKRL